MNIDQFNDMKILESWNKNATSWTSAVREGQIESRQLITNQAIIEAILSRSPSTVLDVGCGEGWLARALAAQNIHVVGVDAVPSLITQAQAAGGSDFRRIAYEEITANTLQIAVDIVVCNFSLFGQESVESLFKAIQELLNSPGFFIVQTLHPMIACGDFSYQEGWREGSWAGFSSDFIDPAPWYFRTLESWVTLFLKNGFRLLEVREPIHPNTLKPISVIFIAEVASPLIR